MCYLGLCIVPLTKLFMNFESYYVYVKNIKEYFSLKSLDACFRKELNWWENWNFQETMS